MASIHPYYRRSESHRRFASRDFSALGDRVDLTNVAHFRDADADAVSAAQEAFDARAAACVSAAVAIDGTTTYADGPVRIWPPVGWINHDGSHSPTTPWFWVRDMLELKWYDGEADTIYLLTAKCLPALAYADFFSDRPRLSVGLRTMVSAAVLAAGPGWCGTFGPNMNSTADVIASNGEGNYDMTQMRLLHMAYQYHHALSPEARERLVNVLLAHGRINRVSLDHTLTSGRAPNDWDRAGYVAVLGLLKTNIGETENHILMIATVRYLTNQLLYQRHRRKEYDNRRNGSFDEDDGFGASCTSILLTLLRNFLRDDFSEYNAKNYQVETRWALTSLCTYAYDHEVRLAARMVLDYVSAHVAVSSNDLRRLVPFRRRNEPSKVSQIGTNSMSVALLHGWPNGSPSPKDDASDETDRAKWETASGGDPISMYFGLQAGNLEAYETPPPGSPWRGRGIPSNGADLAMEALSDYRLPESIHDLFINHTHRRFFQRLHRTVRADEMGGNHNCDNMEIFAASPSYLISAGGSPCGHAVDPRVAGVVFGKQGQQVGVALTTSFMPTTGRTRGAQNNAGELIQFSQFAEGGHDHPPRNYGVAPDFACGHNLYLPQWAKDRLQPHAEGWAFLDASGWSTPKTGRRRVGGSRRGPGFYLAIYQSGNLGLLEAFDTWLHPGLTFGRFKDDVLQRNPALSLREHEPFIYTTWNGNRLDAVIWTRVHTRGWNRNSSFGAEIYPIQYGTRDPQDAIGDAGNVQHRFLSGTILNSSEDALIEIANPALGTKITLDMRDPWHPRRTAESGAVEEAGNNHEVWLDFDWRGPSAGDVCQPFKTVAAANDAVADGGVIKVMPGTTIDRSTIGAAKRFSIVAPIGGVTIGAQHLDDRIAVASDGPSAENVRKDDVWVQFDFPSSSKGNAPGTLPLNNLAEAVKAVSDGDVIRIVPGATPERLPIGGGKRFTLSAPIGGVVIGVR